MLGHSVKTSEDWKRLPWRKYRQNQFRLQSRVYKAIRAGDTARAKNLQKLILRSRAARMLAIRQVTQLNEGKKTAGIDGKKFLTFKERFELEQTLAKNGALWKHQKLREIPILKKNGKTRILKVPTMVDRAWQCLVKSTLEPAHEAIFNARNYGFRPGRSAHDAQRLLFQHLKSDKNGKEKRILELDIEKCFDRISHKTIMDEIIAPQNIKAGIFKCLKVGVNPEFPEQGTPQGGVVSPLLANIALNGIEEIHPSIRYADDMVIILKPNENAEAILERIKAFLANRGMNISLEKTRVTAATDGFDFLGWHHQVLADGRFRSVPSEDNYRAFRKKVKAIISGSNYGAKVKTKKLAPIVRGWRNYHRHCKLNGSRFSLWHLNHRAWKVFNKESKLNRYQTDALIKHAFPNIPYSENRHVMVKGNKSPFDGDIKYWSQRQSKLYNGTTAKTLIKQHHTCGHCGLRFVDEERIHLHHIDGNHGNWNPKNLMAIHESCHDYIHRGKGKLN